MKTRDFFSKFKSRYFWGNILAMVIVFIGLIFGVKLGLGLYTHHGENIVVPDLTYKSIDEARQILQDEDLLVEVIDSGYQHNKPADCILEQIPHAGNTVKKGRVIYLTVNSPNSPTLPLPDISDNSSAREAEAKLKAMGFLVPPYEYIPGEEDWVYGIKYNGHSVFAGTRVPVNSRLVLVVGNGHIANDDMDGSDSITNEEEPNKQYSSEREADSVAAMQF
jgi:eukaryotic-like serine/threonine-protein kinase